MKTKKRPVARKASETQQITRSPNHRNIARAATVQPDSFDAASRSVTAVLSTPIAVRVYDWANDRQIDEVLLPWGCRPVEHVMFLDRHNEYDNMAVIGSVEEINPDNADVTGKLVFSSSPDVEPLFIRVKEKHLRSVSIGGDYSMENTVEIAPGRSRKFRDLTLTATDVPMVVARIWELQHVGLVQRGADADALIRERNQKNQRQNATRKNTRHNSELNTAMPNTESDEPSNPSGKHAMRFSTRALKYLQDCGLPVGANKSATLRFCNELSPTKLQTLFNRDRNAAKILERSASNGGGVATADDDDSEIDTESEDTESQEEGTETVTRSTKPRAASSRRAKEGLSDGGRSRGTGSRSSDNESSAVAIERERQRVKAIRELATPEIPEKLINRACDDGLTIEETRELFYDKLKSLSRTSTPRRDQNAATGMGAAIHTRRNVGLAALQGGLMLRYGIDLDSPRLQSRQGQAMLSRDAKWLVRANKALKAKETLRDEDARALDEAHRYQHCSMQDVCRQFLKATGQRVSSNPEEVRRAAFSSLDLPKAFGPVVLYQILQGYMSIADTTQGWVKRRDWSDFRMNDMLGVDPSSRLKPHTRNTQAPQISLAERSARYALSRMVGMFQLDEMDIINDRLGITQDLASTLGKLAGEVPIDLVYAWLLSNSLSADGVATFHASHNNLLTGLAFTPDNIETLEGTMGAQTYPQADGTVKPINMKAGWLIVARSKRLKAKKYLTSVTRTDSQGNDNALNGEFRYVADQRLDTGVVHPITGAWVAGAPKGWFMAEENGEYGLEIGYRQGTGRAPQTRAYSLNQPGQWGMAWDVNMDVGIGQGDYRGLAQGVEP